MLVPRMGGIYEVRRFDGIRWHDIYNIHIYVPSFMTVGSGIQVIIGSLPKKFERLQCWYY
jgi:hypothetical protein